MIEIRTFRDIIRLFFIFKREFRWALIATTILIVVGAFILPSRYVSESRLLVKPGRAMSTVPIEYSDRQTLVAPSTQRDPVVDEEKMLTGRPVIRQVAEYYLNEVNDSSEKKGWKLIKFYIKQGLGNLVDGVRSVFIFVGLSETQTPVDRLASKLEKQFTVTHEPGSSVMEISFTWDEPLIAQRVVNKWIEFYQTERGKKLANDSLYSFYEIESQKIAGQIASNKEKIAEKLKNIDGMSSKEKLESLTDRINKVSAQRAEAYVLKQGLESGMLSARRKAGSLPKEVSKERELGLNPIQQDFKLKLSGLILERLDKLKNYQDQAPPIAELNRSISSLKEQISKEKETVQRSENRVPNELVTMLKRSALERDMRVSELKTQIVAYDAELVTLKEERQRILSIDPELSDLERDLAIAEKNYRLYIDSLEKARIDRELDNSRISNIAVIEQATFSPGRVFPKSLMMLLMALPAGFAVGLFVIYICYLLDQRIHDGGKVKQHFGVPLWTTVMEQKTGILSASFEASIYRLYSQLPLAILKTQGLNIGMTSSRHGEGVSYLISQFQRILNERGIPNRLADGECARPGEVVLGDASALLSNQEAFVRLKQADLILLVIEAGQSTVPMVENTLSILNTAFKKVDGIIINRRQFEISSGLLSRISR
ncbi:exopolysaccharide transport family protein [Iodobacter ciconiae]|uniref:Lipopolysaccharide biosynthesis protein n=1 Tax=Iodobacter ciconiae TaxID=2496266 RepID=A0A3S8ZQ87_9NEIS|nr:lipopolysaccharide biosynthesis protein [Iodobacter ciconiae]AZN35633.1 lipopolysaccharide biosynthesis protein [Iodobacter ciconiae]